MPAGFQGAKTIRIVSTVRGLLNKRCTLAVYLNGRSRHLVTAYLLTRQLFNEVVVPRGIEPLFPE